MNQLEMTDPEDLLPEDQYLLEVDPEDLAKASSDGRKTWRSNLETALIVAENHKQRREQEADNKEQKDSTGGIKSDERESRIGGDITSLVRNGQGMNWKMKVILL